MAEPSLEELTLDVVEVMEDFVAHGIVAVDRATKPPIYKLLPRAKMTPTAQVYFDQLFAWEA